jgi:hypothetical protein
MSISVNQREIEILTEETKVDSIEEDSTEMVTTDNLSKNSQVLKVRVSREKSSIFNELSF